MMNAAYLKRRRRNASKPNRLAVSLIEVIACMTLVTVMIVPIAAVIRSSGQSIARADGSTSTEAKLRRALRWLGDTVRNSEIVSVNAKRLQIRLSSGDTATVEVKRGTLLLDDGRGSTTLAENVRDIRFAESTQAGSPTTRIGVSMTLRARDPVTRSWVRVDATVATRPQL